MVLKTLINAQCFYFFKFNEIQVLEVLTKGHDSEIAKSLRIPKLSSDDDNELDDYSMIFGYDIPIDTLLEDYL